MKSKDWWRNIPHPFYGNYGGRGNNGNGYQLPYVDKMDKQFKIHDVSLFHNEDPLVRKEIDKILYESLLKIKIKDLKYPIYGSIYRFFCLLVFNKK